MPRRVVITGLGTVNPLAVDVGRFWDGLLAGRSGIGMIQQFDTTAFKVKFGGEIKNWDPDAFLDPEVAGRLDRFAQFALAASKFAVEDSGLDFVAEDPFRCGVILGSSIGGVSEYEEQHTRCNMEGPNGISPLLFAKMVANSAVSGVSIAFGLCGPNTAVTTACASAAYAVGDALLAIRYDKADIMLAGGSDAAIKPLGLGGFISARALSLRNDNLAEASRPFDKDRDGFVLSEGAGMVVLEEYQRARNRGATIYAELLGSGSTADAHNFTAPDPEGASAAMAIRLALRDAKVDLEDVQYVNAHGTSTPLGDAAETKALKLVFGSHAKKLAVSSTKSMIGHLLGASGGVELIATVLSIRDQVVHPTINLHTPDPACDLDYVPNTAREIPVRRAISNSFGFGGHNCCLVLGKVA